ncbi:MAG: O-acetyl-ADP-ribose deacetylase [Endomicrobiia bacterium]
MKDKIMIILDDITKLDVDVIVNAANTSLLGGGGVDSSIHKAAGKQLLEECKTLGGCKTGEAKITKGYNLVSKYVIHTVGPVWNNGKHNESKLLENCYINSLNLLLKYDLKTIAFPSISTGAYRFPIEQASKIAIKSVYNIIQQNINKIEKVYFVCFSQKDFEIYKKEYNYE